MASPNSPGSEPALIAGQFFVDTARPLAPVGGLATFAAIDQQTGRGDLMAVQAQRRLPPRLRALQAFSAPIDGLLCPLGHGSMRVPGSDEAYYVICQAPSGPNVLARSRPWPESELLEHVLRPIAVILEQLQVRGVTHRAIRLDNVFQGQPGQPVVLGSAWAAPPASVQPALFEPPYSAMCMPAGRGDGSIADDVYALGVLMLCLALGRAPQAHLDDAAIVRRKLELGSFAALAGDERLPPVIADLVRGMLAEDPEHRPTPTLLLDPASARSRRVAARPPRRAQRPMTMAGSEIWDARSLARGMAIDWEQGIHALRGGTVVQWLRRGLGDGLLAARMDELVRHRTADAPADDVRGDAALVMRAIPMLDPLAPLCWRGLAFWPDGIGAALAATRDADPDAYLRIEEVIGLELADSWAATRAERCDFAMLRVEARQQRGWLQLRGPAGGALRLTYLLNPLLPCASPLMRNRWVVRLSELLTVLEETSGQVDRKQIVPVDAHVAAFVAARSERRLDSEISAITGNAPQEEVCLAQLRLLAQLQARHHPQPLPGLAGWLAAQAGPLLETWKRRDRRSAAVERLQASAEAGYLAPMLSLLEDPVGHSFDNREALSAAAELERIDAELAGLGAGGRGRALIANRLGQEIAAGLGLAALATVLAIAALG